MDQRGHGEADKPEQWFSLFDHTADLGAFKTAVRLDSAVVVGSSSGD
jgi:rifampin ADP-ribosylating transferase